MDAAQTGDRAGDQDPGQIASDLLLKVAAGEPVAPELLEALAAAVLDQPTVRLALQIQADPSRLGPALELAALLRRGNATARVAL